MSCSDLLLRRQCVNSIETVPYVLYAMCVFLCVICFKNVRVSKIFWKKILSPKMCVDMTRKVSTSFRLGVAETACVGLLCADSIPCMSACLENLQKKILSPKCVLKFYWFFFKYTKVSYFYFLEDSAKFHRNIPYVLYALKMCVFPKYSEKNSKSKNVCWHDTEGEHFVQARCSRNRLWSRTPLCWFNTLHVRVFRKFAEKNSKSQNVCWNFFDFFLNIQKCLVLLLRRQC